MIKLMPRWLRIERMLGLFLLFNCFAVSTFAQVVIMGKTTSADGKDLPGVTVAIRNTKYVTASNATGVFNFDADVKPGNIVLIFSSVGFKTKELTLKVEGNVVDKVNVSMVEDVLGLDEVVVTGTSAATSKGTKKIRTMVSRLGIFIAHTNYNSLQYDGTTVENVHSAAASRR